MAKTKAKKLETIAVESGILEPRRRGRRGGNPDLVKFQFQKKGEEARVKTLGWKVTEAEFIKAKQIPQLNDRFREWLSSQLETSE